MTVPSVARGTGTNPSSSPETDRFLVFKLDDQRYALHLSAVERVVSAVEIHPLPKAPAVVLGVINVSGEIVPVIDIRGRFRLAGKGIEVTDHFIIAQTARRKLAISVDQATGLIEVPREEIVSPESVVPGMEHVEGIAKLQEGMVLIHNLDRFLSLDEEASLEQAI